MISIDDYSPNNYKLAELIQSYGLEKDTWFAIELRYDESESQIKWLSDMGFNIASHTCTHAFLSQIPISLAEAEMRESKRRIEEITGKPVEWLVTPRGRGNDEVYTKAFELGYKYIRTTKLCDDSEQVRGGAHLSYPRAEYDGVDPFDWAKQSKLDHYWCHMFELEKFGLMDKFEGFLKWYKLTKYNKSSKIDKNKQVK